MRMRYRKRFKRKHYRKSKGKRFRRMAKSQLSHGRFF